MFPRKSLIMVAGGVVLTAAAIAAAGIVIGRQAERIRNNVHAFSRGMYNVGSALQLLSGAQPEADCDCPAYEHY